MRFADNGGRVDTPATCLDDLMPPGAESDAVVAARLQAEIDALKHERSMLLGRIDALMGEIEAAQRSTADAYERGKRDGERLRSLPSIISR